MIALRLIKGNFRRTNSRGKKSKAKNCELVDQYITPYNSGKLDSFIKIGDTICLKFINQENQGGILQGDGIFQDQLELVQCLIKTPMKRENYTSIKIMFVSNHSRSLIKQSLSRIVREYETEFLIKKVILIQKSKINLKNKRMDQYQHSDKSFSSIIFILDAHQQQIKGFQLDKRLAERFSLMKKKIQIQISKQNLGITQKNKAILFFMETDYEQFHNFYYLNVRQYQEKENEQFDEINASLNHCCFQLKSYMTWQEQQNMKETKQGQILNGDSIFIKNKNSQSCLCITKKKQIEQKAEMKESLVLDIAKEYELNVKSDENFIQQSEELWQIEMIETLQQNCSLTKNSSFALKHQLTGLYLKVEKVVENSQNVRVLGTSPYYEDVGFIFTLQFENDKNNICRYCDLISIMQQEQEESQGIINYIIFVKNGRINLGNPGQVDYRNTLFSFETSSGQDFISIIVTNSIYFSLLNSFYQIIISQNLTQSHQNQMLNLTFTLDCVQKFLSEQKLTWLSREKKQLFLAQSEIFWLLLQILKSYSSLLLELQRLDQISIENFYMIIQKIIQTLKQLVYNNSEVCDQILSNYNSINLLFSLITDNKDVFDLTQVIVLFSNKISKDFIRFVLSKLSPMIEQNILNQSQFIKILTQMMIDKYGYPRKNCQIACIKYLKSLSEKQEAIQHFKLFFKLEVINKSVQLKFFQLNINDNKQFFQFVKVYFSNIEDAHQLSLDFIRLKFQQNQQCKKQLLQIYENYFANILFLFSTLCQGRNYQGIDFIIKNIQITPQVVEQRLMQCQGKQDFSMRFQSAFLSLFINLFLNIDPMFSYSILVSKGNYFLSNEYKQIVRINFHPSNNIEVKNSIQNCYFEEMINLQNLYITKKRSNIKILHAYCQISISEEMMNKFPTEDLMENLYTKINLVHKIVDLGIDMDYNLDIPQQVFNTIFFYEIEDQIENFNIQNVNEKLLMLLKQHNQKSIYLIQMIQQTFKPNLIKKIKKQSFHKKIFLLNLPSNQLFFHQEVKSLLLSQSCLKKSTLKRILPFKQDELQNQTFFFFNGLTTKLSYGLPQIQEIIPRAIKYIKNQKYGELLEDFENIQKFVETLINFLQDIRCEKIADYQQIQLFS